MCMFCTAVPMTVALGARAHAKHIEKRKEAISRGEPPPAFITPTIIHRTTAAVTLGLVMGAVAYHAIVSPQLNV